jgi:beta-glucosidase
MEVVYEEGIYVGYRYYKTFHVPVSYEFGFGLSYTSFDYGNIKLNDSIFKDKIMVSMEVKNKGKLPGKEVVQLYLQAPAVSMDKPAQELKAFCKTNLLNPGESQVIHFCLKGHDLASFDTKSSSWVADPGSYKICIGSSSEDIRQTAGFELRKSLDVEKVSNALAPPREIPQKFVRP